MKRDRLNTTLAVLAAATLIVASTVAEGLRDGRWSAPPGPMLAKVNLPAVLGDWERDAGPTALGGPVEGVEWTYRRQRPERTARVCVVAGTRRTLHTHAPQLCYPRLSLRSQGPAEAVRLQADAIQAEAWRAAFLGEEPAGRRKLIAVWATRTGGTWTTAAPGDAAGPLVRLYLFAEEAITPPAEGDRLTDLARAVLVELEESLGPALNRSAANEDTKTTPN
jgi:hypothetical protein